MSGGGAPSLRLQVVALRDYRNIRIARVSLPGPRVFFLGRNGEGKSNLLESIGFAHALRSFRTQDLGSLVRQGAEEATLLWEWQGGHSVMAECRITRQGRAPSIDGQRIRRLEDWMGHFPSVVLANEDLNLVRGPPALRRRFLDLLLSTVRPEYLTRLQSYHRGLRERNRLLRDRSDDALLAAFEYEMAECAAFLNQQRRLASCEINSWLAELFIRLTGTESGVQAGWRLVPGLASEDAHELRSAWKRGRDRDRQTATTQQGPHRDRIDLTLNALAAAEFASEGQQRALVLSLRLVQFRYLSRHLDFDPLLLADDVLGELDPEKRLRFWSLLPESVQVLATGTERPAVTHGFPWHIITVQNGTFFPEE